MATLGPFDFRGGLSHGYDFGSFPQDRGYAHLMQGCYIKGGCVVPRWSITQLNTATLGSGTQVVGGLAVWNDTVNSVKTVVATCGAKIYTSADISAYIPQTDSGNSQTIVFTDRTGAITIANSVLYTFDSLNNILVVAGNSSAPVAPNKITAYNANAAALGGAPPNADCVKQVNNFLFLARNLSSTTAQSTVYWSNVNDPETWTGTNLLNFRKNDGEPIMALGAIGTDLYIFKQNSIGRLSTVTLTVSGAVTLGPLSTVIQGVGCCGPKALDNLPNGNIVFVGFDGHFYEFDGSTVIDRSKQPYPGPNVYDTPYFSSTANNTWNQGMSACLADTTVCVKTIRGNNEVWVSFTNSAFNNGNMTFIYNFENNRWLDNPNKNYFTNSSLAEVNIAANLGLTYPMESTCFVLCGDNVGRILSTGSSVRSYPKLDYGSAATLTGRLGTIIRLLTKDGLVIPRFLCLELDCPTLTAGSTLASFNINVDFDSLTAATNIYTSAATTIPNRIVATIPFKTDPSGTNIFPSSICVEITFTGTGSGSTSNKTADIIRIGSLWLSDEVIR